MCVIVFVPKGETLPVKATLEQCYRRNPDGCGFSWCADDKVHIKKGFFSFKDFWKAVRKIKLDETPLLMHFRIKTHGDICEELTHPFAVSKSYDDMRKTEYSGQCVMAHNGVLDLPSEKDVSDSMTLAKIFADTSLAYRAAGDKTWREILDKVIKGSRVAVLWRNGVERLYGEGWIQEGGVWYSNTSFRVQMWAKPRNESSVANIITKDDLSQADEDCVRRHVCPLCDGTLSTTYYCSGCDVFWPYPSYQGKSHTVYPKHPPLPVVRPNVTRCTSCGGAGHRKDSGAFCFTCAGEGYIALKSDGYPIVKITWTPHEIKQVVDGKCPSCQEELLGYNGRVCIKCWREWREDPAKSRYND